jgi:hypothetical protein
MKRLLSFQWPASRRILIWVTSLWMFSLGVAAELPPGNDQCSGAIPILPGVTVEQSTSNATSSGDPTNSCHAGSGVWFVFKSHTNATALISTCESAFSTDLQVFGGSCESIATLARSCGTASLCSQPNRASLKLNVTNSGEYFILASGTDGAAGNLKIRLDLLPLPNEYCAGALPLTIGVPFTFTNTGYNSHVDPGNLCASTSGHGAWFQVRPEIDGILNISTCGTVPSTMVQAYRGGCDALLPSGCSYFGCESANTGELSINVEAHQLYLLFVDTMYGATGTITLQANFGPRLPNDSCAGAIPLTNGIPFTMLGGYASSFGETELACGNSISKGLWFSYVAEEDGVLDYHRGLSVNTLAYSGNCGALVPMDINCLSPMSGDLFVPVKKGQKYWLLTSASPTLTVRADLLPPLTNLSCANALELLLDQSLTMSIKQATNFSPPRAKCTGQDYYYKHAVWYKFTSPVDGSYVIELCANVSGYGFAGYYDLYSGDCDSLALLTDVCLGFNTCASPLQDAPFYAPRGSSIYVLVNPLSEPAELKIQVTRYPTNAPTNDLCAGAIPLLLGQPQPVNLMNSSALGDHLYPSQSNVSDGVWYSFTPESEGAFRISTCDVGLLNVYSGACSNLVPTAGACSRQVSSMCSGKNSFTTTASWRAQQGLTYWLLVSGGGSNSTIQVDSIPAPTNDICNGAVPLQLGVPYQMITTNATAEEGAGPDCPNTLRNGVWFKLVAPENGLASVNTDGIISCFGTLKVFTGDCANLTPVLDGSRGVPGSGCTYNFEVQSGSAYWILASGSSGFGPLTIKADMVSAITNDHCEGAIHLESGIPLTISNANATTAGDPIPECQTDFSRGVWFTFTPSSNGVVVVDTCGSDFTNFVQVYSGMCGNFTGLGDACANTGLCSLSARSSFLGHGGQTYYILAGGVGSASGNLRITASVRAQPTNDICAGAMEVNLGGRYFPSNLNATRDGDPAQTCEAAWKGLWFHYAASESARVIVSTCGSDFDNVVQVYAGTCGSLIPLTSSCEPSGLACSSGHGALAIFDGVNGSEYWIWIGGVQGNSGPLTLRLIRAPANDSCGGALPLLPGVATTVVTSNATSLLDPTPSCKAEVTHGVWFSFMSPTNALVALNTCGTDYTNVLQVFSGECGNLQPNSGSCSTDSGSKCASRWIFRAEAAVAYRIFVAGDGPAQGTLVIRADVQSTAANDFCDQAIPLVAGIPVRTTTTNATTALEPIADCHSDAGKSVWFSYTPTEDGVATVSTCNSSFNTILRVYTGTCASPIPLTSSCAGQRSPNCPNSSSASVAFQATSGVSYWILAAGIAGSGGTLEILIDSVPNDICSGAIPLAAGTLYSTYTTNSSSIGDPAPFCQTNFGKGIWFTYAPERDTLATINTCGSTFDTVLQLYTGLCSSLAPVAGGCNDNFGPVCLPDFANRASVSVPMLAGNRYFILAGGYAGASGLLQIRLDTSQPARNSVCEEAVPLQPGELVQTSTRNFIGHLALADTCAPSENRGAWYSFTPTQDGIIEIETCESSFDTVLRVFFGGCSSPISLSPGCNDDSGPLCSNSTRASVQFGGTAGTTYRIFASGYSDQTGTLAIRARFFPIRISSLAFTPAGNFRINFEGDAAINYTVSTSSNLVDWIPGGAPIMVAPGRYQFDDISGTRPPLRFFRIDPR